MTGPTTTQINRLPDQIELCTRRKAPTLRQVNGAIMTCNAILRMNVGKGLKLIKSDGGYYLEAESGSGAGTGSLNWRDEWDATVTNYATGDVVIIGSNNVPGYSYKPILAGGARAGTYVGLKDSIPSGTDPANCDTDAGHYWDRLSRFTAPIWTVTNQGTDGSLATVQTDCTKPTVTGSSEVQPMFQMTWSNGLGTKLCTVRASTIDLVTPDGIYHDVKFRRMPVCYDFGDGNGPVLAYAFLLASKIIRPSDGLEVEPYP